MSYMKQMNPAILAAMMLAGNATGSKTRIQDIDFSKKEAPQPKGTLRFYFNEKGGYCNTPQPGLTVYTTIAVNEKNAIRKFKNWQKKLLAA